MGQSQDNLTDYLVGDHCARELRIGVLLDSLTSAPRYIRRILDDIVGFNRLKLVIAVGIGADRRAYSPAKQRLRARQWERLWKSDLSYDEQSDPTHRVNIVDITDQIPERLTGSLHSVDFAEDVENSLACSCKAANLDVLLCLATGLPVGELVKCARYGAWSLHFSDSDAYRGEPPLFWEMYERSPIIGAVLRLLTTRQEEYKVIYKSYSALHAYSLQANRNRVYWKASAFVLRKLKELIQDGAKALESISATSAGSPKTFSAPDPLRALKFGVSVRWTKLLQEFEHKHWGPRWYIAYANRGIGRHEFKTIEPPRGRLYADPFIVTEGDCDYIFFENDSFIDGKGIISCVKIDHNGNASRPFTVLEETFHLSYPGVFKQDKHFYMIPETMDSGSIRLYRCEKFPDVWRLDRILIHNIGALDPTLCEYEGKYWLFANVPEKGASWDDELHVFYADSLASEWKSHPKNPIISDVRRARPAGNLFIQNGQLYRVSQNCTPRYGYSINILKVEELNTKAYRETLVEEIVPSWLPGKSRCTHTLNRNSRYVVTDGCTLSPKTVCGRFLPVGLFAI